MKYYVIPDYLYSFRHFKDIYTKSEKTIIRLITSFDMEYKDFVVKIGDSELLHNDFYVSNEIANRGFMDFIEYYRINYTKDNTKSIIISPFIKSTSIKEFIWSNTGLFLSCFLQLLYNLYLTFKKIGFIHGNIHLNNVLMVQTNDTFVNYDCGDDCDDYELPIFGYKILIVDFEHSQLFVNDSKVFYREISHILNDIQYNIKPKFVYLLQNIHKITIERCYIDSDINNFMDIINIVKNMLAKYNTHSTLTTRNIDV